MNYRSRTETETKKAFADAFAVEIANMSGCTQSQALMLNNMELCKIYENTPAGSKRGLWNLIG